MLKKVFILYLLVSNIFLFSQEHKEVKVDINTTITRNNLHQDIGIQIFDLIGNTKQSNPDSIKIDVSFNLIIKIKSQPPDNYNAMLSASIINVEPDFDLLGFDADTIILPSLVHFMLVVSNEFGQIDTLKVSCSPYEEQYNLNMLSNLKGDLTLEVANVTYAYDADDYLRLDKFINAVKNYYSYGYFLNYINEKYSDISMKNTLSSHDVFMHKIELDRIAYNLDSINHTYSLNIKDNDPIAFSDELEKFNRYLKRYETLFLNLLSTSDSYEIEPNEFCSQFANTSNDYLLIADKLQPQEAFAFVSNAYLNGDFDSQFTLEAIADYYAKLNGRSTDDTYKLIIGEFIEKAYYWRSMENFNNSLILLNNAFIISEQFDITLPKSYDSLKIEITEGLALSFIRVGNMALSNGNIDFGNKYISKSNELLHNSLQSIYGLEEFDERLEEILVVQNMTIGSYSELELFDDAIELSNLSALICLGRTYDYCLKGDSIRCVLESDILNAMLMDLSLLIDNNQYLDASKSLAFIVDSINGYKCEDNNLRENYKQLSDSLYATLISEGKKLISVKKPTKALEFLLDAKEICENNRDDIYEINELIKFAAEPMILGYIDNAKYDTWKNNIDSASHKLNMAMTLNQKYFLSNNDRINIAIDNLQEQMMYRDCIDIGNGYIDAIRKAEIHIRNKSFTDLPTLVSQASAYLHQNNECKLDSNILYDFISKYKYIIEYQKTFNDVLIALLDKDYIMVIDIYQELGSYYYDHESELTDVSHNDLMPFIKNQDLYQLTIQAMLYSISNNDLDNATNYMKLAYDQGANMKEIKPSIMKLAKLLAIRDNAVNLPVNETLQLYTDDLVKMNYFKIIYVKNRVVKPSE